VTNDSTSRYGNVPQHGGDEDLVATIRRQRIEKIAKLREAGVEPYPSGPVEKTSATDALKLAEGTPVTVAGRVMLFRVMGNIACGCQSRLQVLDQAPGPGRLRERRGRTHGDQDR
jgi:hypothetical protein